MTTPHFLFGAASMGLATLVFAYAFASDARNRLYHALLVGITGVATVAYVLMFFDVWLVSTPDGRVVHPIRYVDWIVTTPMIIFYLGLLAGVSRRVLATTSLLNVVMVGLGLAANFVTGVRRYALFAVSTVLFAVLLYYLMSGVMSAVRNRPDPVVSLFVKLRNLTVVIWAFYPVLWILGPVGLGLLEGGLYVLLFSYLDLTSKGLFGVIAYNSKRSLPNLPQLDALRITGEASAD